MNLQNYTQQKISLFGKTRAFEFEELSTLLRQFDIELTLGYNPDASVIIEGAVMPTPLKERAAELYKEGGYEFIEIDHFEQEVAKQINAKKLLMHLKLSNNQEKIFHYLQNDYIGNDLFLDLLKLYHFHNEDFFENDTNRDVTAALIRRFYPDYIKNHNIQYSSVGLINVIENTDDTKLLEILFSLFPIQKALQDPTSHNAKIVKMFALHPSSSHTILKKILKSEQTEYIEFIAQRSTIPHDITQELVTFENDTINLHLATSSTLPTETLTILVQKGYGTQLAQHLQLTPELFTLLRSFPTIALNPSLTQQMADELFKDTNYHSYLAQNPSSPLTKELLALNDKEITQLVYTHHNISDQMVEIDGYEIALATNRSTPQTILTEIFQKNIEAANYQLAQNEATPVDILYQLSFDMRYAQHVKANPAFGEHIKTTHAIGIFE